MLFPFTGTISKVDFKLGPPQMLPEDNKAVQDMKDNTNRKQGADSIGRNRLRARSMQSGRNV